MFAYRKHYIIKYTLLIIGFTWFSPRCAQWMTLTKSVFFSRRSFIRKRVQHELNRLQHIGLDQSKSRANQSYMLLYYGPKTSGEPSCCQDRYCRLLIKSAYCLKFVLTDLIFFQIQVRLGNTTAACQRQQKTWSFRILVPTITPQNQLEPQGIEQRRGRYSGTKELSAYLQSHSAISYGDRNKQLASIA